MNAVRNISHRHLLFRPAGIVRLEDPLAHGAMQAAYSVDGLQPLKARRAMVKGQLRSSGFLVPIASRL